MSAPVPGSSEGAPRDGKRLWFDWLPVIAYMALIWWLSSRQVRLPPSLAAVRDKVLHLVEYGALGLVLARAALHTWPGSPRQATLAAFLVTVLWGAIDELHQSFVPGRDADPLDLVADTVGALLGVWAFTLLSRLWQGWRARRAGEAGAAEAER